MDAQEFLGGTVLRAMMFSTIASTVGLAYPMAWVLGVRLPRRE